MTFMPILLYVRPSKRSFAYWCVSSILLLRTIFGQHCIMGIPMHPTYVLLAHIASSVYLTNTILFNQKSLEQSKGVEGPSSDEVHRPRQTRHPLVYTQTWRKTP